MLNHRDTESSEKRNKRNGRAKEKLLMLCIFFPFSVPSVSLWLGFCSFLKRPLNYLLGFSGDPSKKSRGINSKLRQAIG